MEEFEFLWPAKGPVVTGFEDKEVRYAEDQPEYETLRVLRSNDEKACVLSRWTLTPEQRRLIADGADVFLELLTFGAPLQPIRMMVVPDGQMSLFSAYISMDYYG